MKILNAEFKARVPETASYEARLHLLHPEFRGEDHQTDTYFRAAQGRLKLREGQIEQALIWYDRQNTADIKASDILLYTAQPDAALKAVLTQAMGVLAVVEKRRRIYFIGHVKFHFDTVTGLGSFLEVEAIDTTGTRSMESLQADCDHYFRYLGLQPADLEALSYSDMILRV